MNCASISRIHSYYVVHQRNWILEYLAPNSQKKLKLAKRRVAPAEREGEEYLNISGWNVGCLRQMVIHLFLSPNYPYLRTTAVNTAPLFCPILQAELQVKMVLYALRTSRYAHQRIAEHVCKVLWPQSHSSKLDLSQQQCQRQLSLQFAIDSMENALN